MGFAKAFNYGTIKNLTIPISKPAGILWMLTAFLFIMATVLFLIKKEAWIYTAVIAVALSQVLIVMVWKDAKWGTIANMIILVAVILSWGSYRFEKRFLSDVQQNLDRTNALKVDVLTEADLLHLPFPVQNYLRYAGVLNKPKVKNMRIVFEGEMGNKGKKFMPFISEQYNFFDEPTRLFYMKAKMVGVTVPGYHKYEMQQAGMDIRPFGLFSMVNFEGNEMNKTETVTYFNDLCLFAPSALIDRRIQWELIDSSSVRAVFTNKNISISAVLYFNNQGQLIDFISNDRYEVNQKLWIPFSTPVSNYQSSNGILLGTYGETVWHYNEGAFTYGKFHLKELEYNVNVVD